MRKGVTWWRRITVPTRAVAGYLPPPSHCQSQGGNGCSPAVSLPPVSEAGGAPRAPQMRSWEAARAQLPTPALARSVPRPPTSGPFRFPSSPAEGSSRSPFKDGTSESPPGSDPTAARTRPGTPGTARGPLLLHCRQKRRAQGSCPRARPRWPRRRRATDRGKAPAPRLPTRRGGPRGRRRGRAGPPGSDGSGWRRSPATRWRRHGTARREKEGPPRAGAYGRSGRYRQVSAAPPLHGASGRPSRGHTEP